MITSTTSNIGLMQRRYSCRNYASAPLNAETQRAITDILRRLPAGPFQKTSRFALAAASEQDRSALRGLGTYGFIKNPPAFLIGASEDGPLCLEDFAYRFEQLILEMTGLGLGTCWLGGTFNRSAFAQKIAAEKGEILPAVSSLGFPSPEDPQAGCLSGQMLPARERLAWETLFFDETFAAPLSAEASGAFTLPLQMVQAAPSASNKQPWRILKQGKRWHFYMQRSKGYRELALGRFTGIADMQRIDMGIAMCHFELAVKERGLGGRWEIQEPIIETPDTLTSYLVSWNVN
jgi:hypothetical protein